MFDLARRASLFAATAFALALAAPQGPALADVPESSDPIKLAVLEWTGQHITTYIAGQVLERMGYTVEYVTAGSFPSANGTADGDLSATLELWNNNLGDYWPQLLAEGKAEDIGDVGLDAREGWIYPKYVEASCPGLPAWDAFLGCAELFATPETLPNGRFLEYPADWGDRATRLIVENSLAFESVPAGSEGALIAELKSAIEKQQPLVMMFWAPHWVLSTVEYGWVDIPADLVEKYSMNKPHTIKTAWPGLKDKWPAAYKLLKALKITNEIQQPLMDLVDNQGQDVREVTAKWLDENEAVWRAWVDQAMM